MNKKLILGAFALLMVVSGSSYAGKHQSGYDSDDSVNSLEYINSDLPDEEVDPEQERERQKRIKEYDKLEKKHQRENHKKRQEETRKHTPKQLNDYTFFTPNP